MLGLYGKVVLSIASFTAGYLLSIRGFESVSNYVGKLLLYIVIPYLMIYGTLFTKVKVLTVTLIIISVYLTVSAIALPIILGRALHDRVAAASLSLASIFHNVGFLPIPLMTVLYGNPYPAVMYSLLFNLESSFLIPLIAGWGRGVRGGREVLLLIIKFPFVTAALTSLILKYLVMTSHILFEAPHMLSVIADVFTDLNIVSFMIVGSALAKVRLTFRREVTPVIAWRLSASPLIHLTMLHLLPAIPKVWFAGIIIESLMPPATMDLVYARLYKLREDLIALSIAIITPLSIASSVIVKLILP